MQRVSDYYLDSDRVDEIVTAEREERARIEHEGGTVISQRYVSPSIGDPFIRTVYDQPDEADDAR
jgi:hypothetical protein